MAIPQNPSLDPEDHTQKILHALRTTYTMKAWEAAELLADHVANELHAIDRMAEETTVPYRGRGKSQAFTEGITRVRELIFWREMRLRRTAPELNARRAAYRFPALAREPEQG